MPLTYPGFDVALRPLAMADLDAIMEWINDPEVTRNFAGLSSTITHEQEATFLERAFASETDRLYAVVNSDGMYLGNAGIHKIYWPSRNGRIGLVLGAENARGRGLGQQALRLLCAVGFTKLGLHKLWIQHYATNHRMAHIVSKLGFQIEGVLREEYFHEQRFHDMVRHSLLETELEPLGEPVGTLSE